MIAVEVLDLPAYLSQRRISSVQERTNEQVRYPAKSSLKGLGFADHVRKEACMHTGSLAGLLACGCRIVPVKCDGRVLYTYPSY